MSIIFSFSKWKILLYSDLKTDTYVNIIKKWNDSEKYKVKRIQNLSMLINVLVTSLCSQKYRFTIAHKWDHEFMGNAFQYLLFPLIHMPWRTSLCISKCRFTYLFLISILFFCVVIAEFMWPIPYWWILGVFPFSYQYHELCSKQPYLSLCT